jgi:hypothetical protein
LERGEESVKAEAPEAQGKREEDRETGFQEKQRQHPLVSLVGEAEFAPTR